MERLENKDIKFILDTIKTLYSLKKSLVGDLREKVKKYGLNRSEIFTLLHIFHAKKKNMSQLRDDVELKLGSLTAVIDNLVEKGYVERGIDPNDRRRVIVNATKKGAKLAKSLCMFMEKNALGKIEMLSEEDRNEFMKSLDSIKKIIKKLKD